MTPGPRVSVVVVTWQSGGASLPAIGLGRLLADAGHGVRILAPAVYGDRIAAAACRHVPFPAQAEFDPGLGRAMEDQRAYLAEIFHGPLLPAVLAAALAEEPADVVVADYLLRSVVARAADAPAYALLVHTLYRFHGPEPIAGAPLAIVALPRALDDWADPPASVVHAGPITDAPPASEPFALPWADDDLRPLVVVTLGTTYMHQESLTARIARAAARLPARVLVLTGLELGPAELGLPDGVHVAGYVPHDAVLGAADLVVCHGGVGTLIATFAAGVPAVCIPLGRDQEVNAARAEELGAAVVLPPDAAEEVITEAIAVALHAAPLRAAARDLGRRFDDDPRAAVAAIEALHR